MIDKVGDNLYQSRLNPLKKRLFRIGYAAQGTDYQFSKDVSASIERAAVREGIDLLSLDNRYSAKTAQRNADLLVREKVDLAIEFQTGRDRGCNCRCQIPRRGNPHDCDRHPSSGRDLLWCE